MIDAPDRGPEHRIVVAHDWLCGLRGGEQVLERVCALVDRTWGPGAALMVMFDDGRMLTPTVDRWRLRGVVHASTLNRIPGAARWWRRWLFPLYPRAVEGLSRQLAWMHEEHPIDLVISTSSAAIKGLRTPPGVPHLCCCFSPARYVWEEDLYPPEDSLKGRLRSAGLKRFGERFREWDRRTAANVTRFVAISGHIRERIRRAYGVEAEIVFPPARTEYFTVDDSVAREDFWLCVGALETYKRADLAAEAAVAAGVPLKIVGTGSQRSALRRRFGGHKSIEFLGHVHDLDLRDLYRRAGALIFPQVEDFGIVAVEAQACGLPVVAFGAGGASDIVIDGRTGVLFSEQTPEAIVRAAQRVPANAGAACRQNAERFSEAKFDEAFAAQVLAVCPGLKPRERPGYAR